MNKVFTMLIAEEKISEGLAQKVASWPLSVFTIHNGVEIDADDNKGREILAQYIIKAPVSQERMLYDRENQKAVYTSKRGTVSYEPLDWLASITSHIPNKGAQCVHWQPQAHAPPLNKEEKIVEEMVCDYCLFD